MAQPGELEGLVPDRFQPIRKFYTEVIPKLIKLPVAMRAVLIRGCGTPQSPRKSFCVELSLDLSPNRRRRRSYDVRVETKFAI